MIRGEEPAECSDKKGSSQTSTQPVSLWLPPHHAKVEWQRHRSPRRDEVSARTAQRRGKLGEASGRVRALAHFPGAAAGEVSAGPRSVSRVPGQGEADQEGAWRRCWPGEQAVCRQSRPNSDSTPSATAVAGNRDGGRCGPVADARSSVPYPIRRLPSTV